MDFKEQYKDPRWQKRRLKELERTNYTCEICNNTKKTLHIHHGSYLKGLEIWSDSYKLYVLCEDCHEESHDLLEEIKESIGDIHPSNYFALSKLIFGIRGFQISCYLKDCNG